MIKLFLGFICATALLMAVAQAQTSTSSTTTATGTGSETTTTTTEGSGMITTFTPGQTIVLKETTGPRTYRFGQTVTYVTRSGTVLDADAVRTRIKVGIPVRVHYVGEGDKMLVDRVILDQD